MNRKWLKKGISFSEADYHLMHRQFWQEHDVNIQIWNLDETQVRSLVERCRSEEVSVNSLLYAAFLCAQHMIHQPAPDYYDNVLIPVDFRDYLKQDAREAMGLYASAVQIEMDIKPLNSGWQLTRFWETVREFDRRVKRQLTDKNIFASQRMNALHPSLLDGLAFAMFGDLDDEMARSLAERVVGKMRTGVLVSNLGRLDFPQAYGDLRLTALVPPAIFSGNADVAVEILTFGGQMTFTLTHGERVSKVDGVRLRDQVMDWLLKVSA